MSPLLAVALLTVRAALRSRMVALLLALLAGSVLGLPRVLRGDGTPAGELAILLRFTLPACFGLLAIATVWAGCAALASERDRHLLDLTRVKPVRGAELWFGKWLGLLTLDALLLAAVTAGMGAHLAIRTAPDGAPLTPLLVSRRVSRPVLPDPVHEARETLRQALAAGALPAGMAPRAFYRERLRLARNRYTIINPGETASWRIALPRPLRAGDSLTARFRFDVEWGARADVRGRCRVRRAGTTTSAVASPVDDFTLNTLEVPLAAAGLEGATELDLVFEHAGEASAAALLITPRRNVALLIPGGSFASNLARAALVQLVLLSLLAAIGLTLGCLFSFPVASFAAVATLVLVLISSALADDPTETEKTDPLLARAGRVLVLAVGRTVQPLLDRLPFDSLTAGERIGWNDIGRTAGVAALAVPALLAAAGAWGIRRRRG